MRATHTLAVVMALLLTLAGIAQAQPPAPSEEPATEDRTPPRLSYVDGQVSFWRPGAPDWAAAQINTALAPGDELSTGSPGTLEVQIGSRAFVRAWAGSGLGVLNQQPDFLQLKVTAGHASLDLRTLDPGHTVEIDTPNAAFTIEHPGYYRVYVQGDRTSFISRRSGRAIVTPASGQAASIAASEEVIVDGIDTARVASYTAPPLDDWDRWNYARTDYLSDSMSARYVSPGVYGVADLDRYGRWRVVPEYGSVWVPTSVATGFTPYSTGAWTWDPLYGWTWVDTAPWGWAPYHYGRWVFVDSYWAWAPGPVIVRPAYAPALVAFFGGVPGAAVRVGWVPLGWGEPLIPWWGRPRFVGVPWWGGWGGPRVVNNVIINRTTVVNVQNINVYRNASVPNAVVAVDHQRFGRGYVGSSRLPQGETRNLEPVRGRLDVQPVAASLAPTTVRGVRPSDDSHGRPVVATRAPQPAAEPRGPQTIGESRGSAVPAAPAPRLVSPPRERNAALESPRAPFGQGQSERPQRPPPPRVGGARPRDPDVTTSTSRRPATTPPASVAPQTPAPRIDSPKPPARAEAPRLQPRPGIEAPRPQVRQLPGEAADRMSPGRGEPRRAPGPPSSRSAAGESRKGRD